MSGIVIGSASVPDEEPDDGFTETDVGTSKAKVPSYFVIGMCEVGVVLLNKEN